MKVLKRIAIAFLGVFVLAFTVIGTGCKHDHIGVGKCEKCHDDLFETLREYVLKEGDYSSAGYMLSKTTKGSDSTKTVGIFAEPNDSSEMSFALLYTFDDGEQCYFTVMIDSGVSCVYEWISTYDDYYVKGYVSALTYSGTTLSYTSTNASSYLSNTLVEMATLMLDLLCDYMNDLFQEHELGLTMANFGFSYYE